MLYSPHQFHRDQLLADLLAVKAKLTNDWSKGAWQQGEKVCLVAAAELAVGLPVGVRKLAAATEDTKEVRLGRVLASIYTTLYGPHAPTNITMGQVMNHIIRFNDRHANHGAVILLLDRAIEQVTAYVGGTVTAQV